MGSQHVWLKRIEHFLGRATEKKHVLVVLVTPAIFGWDGLPINFELQK